MSDESQLKPWERSFNGLHWMDMPGNGQDEKKLNFYLYRRGKLDLQMEVVGPEGEAVGEVELREAGDEEKGQRTCLQRTLSGKLVRRKFRGAEVSRRKGTVNGIDKVNGQGLNQEELRARRERQESLKRRLSVLSPADLGFINREIGGADYENIRRLLGYGKARKLQGVFHMKVIERLENLLENLPTLLQAVAQRRKRAEFANQQEQDALRARYRAVVKATGKKTLRRELQVLSGCNFRTINIFVEAGRQLRAVSLQCLTKGVKALEQRYALQLQPGRDATRPCENGKEAA